MSEFFTQSELAERLVQKTGVSLETAKKFSSCFFSIVKRGLKTNDRFSVYNFGTFKKTWIETTMGFNPSTGERMEIPAHWRIKFIPCAALAKRLNRPYEKLKPKVIKEKASDNGLLAKAIKIRFDDENNIAASSEPVAHSAPRTSPVIPADEQVKNQRNDDFDDDMDEETRYRKKLFKLIVAAGFSLLLLIVLLILLLKSFFSLSDEGENGKEKRRHSAQDVHIVEEEKQEPSAEDEAVVVQNREENAQDGAMSVDALEKAEDYNEADENGEDGVFTETKLEAGAEAEEEEIFEESVENSVDDKSDEGLGRTGVFESDGASEKEASDLFESYTVPSGLSYHRIAREKLGNRHLWPLLYTANKSVSVDPDFISVNAKIRIPNLDGKSAFEYAQTDLGRDAIFAAALDAYNGYLLMIEKQPASRKNDERRRRAVGAIVSGEVLCPGFIEEKSARIMPEYARLAKNIVEHQYKQ